MEQPQVVIHQVNMDIVRHQASMASGNFFRFPKDKTTFFYLMPPYNETGKLARELYESFGLPQKHFWIGWRSYEIFSPGISEQDPVTNFLKQNSEGPQGEKLADMVPGIRYYANILHVGCRVTSNNKWEPADKPTEVQIAQLPVGVYNKICETMAQPGMDTIINPQSAVLIAVQRSGSGKTGTKYTVQFAGAVAEGPGGSEPRRDNLYEKYGVETMTQVLQNLPDLDSRWPMPSDDIRAKAQTIIRDLRAFISTGAGAPAGAQQGPGGSTMIGAAPTATPPGGYGVQPQQPAAGSAIPPAVGAAPPPSVGAPPPAGAVPPAAEAPQPVAATAPPPAVAPQAQPPADPPPSAGAPESEPTVVASQPAAPAPASQPPAAAPPPTQSFP